MKALLICIEKDGKMLRDLLTIQRRLFMVEVTTTREEAFEAFEKEKPDVVLIKYTGSKTYTILEQLKESQHHARIIAFTNAYSYFTATLINIFELHGYVTLKMSEKMILAIFDEVMAESIKYFV